MEFFKRLLVIFVFLGILVYLFFYLGDKREKEKPERSYYSEMYYYTHVCENPEKFWLPKSDLSADNWCVLPFYRGIEQYSRAVNGNIIYQYQSGPRYDKEKKFFDLIIKVAGTSFLRIYGQAIDGSKIQIEYGGSLFILKWFCVFHLPTSLEINSLVRKILKQEEWDLPDSYL